MRLIGSPLILPILFAYLLPFNNFAINIFLAVVFLIFGGTDFLDGYLARKMNLTSSLGAILDPIADKFLVYSALIGILAAHKIFFYWVIILIGREFFVMGVRQLALEKKVSIPVAFWSKIKTTLQLILITYLVINPYQNTPFFEAKWWHLGELFLIFLTIILSLATAHWYYQEFLHQIGGYEELMGRSSK